MLQFCHSVGCFDAQEVAGPRLLSAFVVLKRTFLAEGYIGTVGECLVPSACRKRRLQDDRVKAQYRKVVTVSG